MATHKHHDDAPCDCEKLKDAEREDLREGLKRCNTEREAERNRRFQEVYDRAEAAEAELKALKKKLIAFQLVTVVASTVLGQEAVDKIMGKVDAAKSLQDKITGKAEGDHKPDEHKKPVSMNSLHGDPLGGFRRPWQKPVAETVAHGNGDISGVFTGKKPKITDHTPIDEAVAVVPVSPATAAIIAAATGEPLPLTLQPKTPIDPYALFFTPSAIPFDQYSTGLALGVNYGFGEFYGTSTGSGGYTPPTPAPSPSSIAVFAMGGLVNTRRRA